MPRNHDHPADDHDHASADHDHRAADNDHDGSRHHDCPGHDDDHGAQDDDCPADDHDYWRPYIHGAGYITLDHDAAPAVKHDTFYIVSQSFYEHVRGLWNERFGAARSDRE